MADTPAGCIHQLGICDDCGGLQITEYTELSGAISGITFDGDNGSFAAPAGTRVFWSPGPTPCEPVVEGGTSA